MTSIAPKAVHCQCGAEDVKDAHGWHRLFGTDICPACWADQMRVIAGNRERHFREEREHRRTWRAKYAEVADCPSCGREGLRVRMPRSRDGSDWAVGDGTARITYFHKSSKTGKDCRSEVDVENVRVIERATRPRNQKQTQPTEGDQMT